MILATFLRQILNLFTLILSLLWCIQVPARAIIVGSGTGGLTDTVGNQVSNWKTGWATPGQTGWNYVGRVSNAAGSIYLGNGWCLTANHVGPGDTTFGYTANGNASSGTKYSYVAGSAIRSVGGADLCLYKVAAGDGSLPNLRPMPLALTPPTVGSTVVMIGFGYYTGTPIVATDGSGAKGFQLTWGGWESWGINTIQQNGESGGGIVTSFNGSPYNADVTVGDSGGSEFVYNSALNQWELVGIISYKYYAHGGTASQAFVDDEATAVAMAGMANAINGITGVPEPKPVVFLAIFLPLLAIRYRQGCLGNLTGHPQTNTVQLL